MPIEILNDWGPVLAVNKPAGWLSIPGRGNKDEIPVVSTELGNFLRQGHQRSSDSPDLYVVHRLDQGTSGVILFARNSAAHKDLSQQFENGEVEKTYLALVKGQIDDPQLIDLPIFKLPSKRNKSVIDPKGKPSQTAIRPLGTANGITLVQAKPKTGRSHQIRVHLAHLGFPLLGDKLYGGPTVAVGIPCPYPLLHSFEISFTWPNGLRKTSQAPIGGEFASVAEALHFTKDL